MKTLVVAGLLIVGVGSQAFSMGHPHNMFAARKQMRAKSLESVSKPKLNSSISCASAAQLAKNAFNKIFVSVFPPLRSTAFNY